MSSEHMVKAEGPKIDDPAILSELQEVNDEMLHEHILKVNEFFDKMMLVGRVDINLHKFFSKFLANLSAGTASNSADLDRHSLWSTSLVIEAPVNEPRHSYICQMLGFCPFPVVMAMRPEFSVRLVPVDPDGKIKPIVIDGKEVSNRLFVRMEYDITRPAYDQVRLFVDEIALIKGQYVVSASDSSQKSNDPE